MSFLQGEYFDVKNAVLTLTYSMEMITTLEHLLFFFYPCIDMDVNDQLFVYSQLTALKHITPPSVLLFSVL